MGDLEALHNLDLARHYCIYNTVYQMMRDRNYTPVEKRLTKKEWISRFLGYLAELEDQDNELDIFGIIDNMTLLFKRGTKQLLVYFHPLDTKLCQTDMSYIHNLMGKKKAQHLVIVANNKATPKVSSVLGILGHNAQFFNEDELISNVTKHQLVPKHVLVTDERERERVLAFCRTSDGQIHLDRLPGMFTNDPIAKYYGYKVDDIIRIERPRKDGYSYITFRVVIKPITDRDKK